MNFLGIDVGTTLAKCRLYSEDGQVLCGFSEGYQTVVSGGERYVDIDALWLCVQSLIRQAAAGHTVDAIAVSSFGESFVLLDREDNVLAPPMLYTDKRGELETAEAAKNIGAEKIFEIAGVFPQSMYSVYKLMWIKENRPDWYARADKLLLIEDFVNYKLTGKRVIDWSLAARTGVFDLETMQFSQTLLNAMGLDGKLFSAPVSSGTVIGEVTESFKRQAGIANPCCVVAGGHDQVMAALGSGVTGTDRCVDGMGTVECITAVLKSRHQSSQMGSQGYPLVPYAAGGFCTYLFNFTCGSLINWFRKTVSKADDSDTGYFRRIESALPPLPTGILTLPYFDGAATPYQDINAKGAFLNLSVAHTEQDLFKSVLEGLCYEMKLNLETAGAYGVNPRTVIAAGGGSKSQAWLQIKADILGKEVIPLTASEAGTCGAAMLAAVALNKYPDLEACARSFVKYGEPVRPDRHKTLLYEGIYQKYRKLYKSVKEFY